MGDFAQRRSNTMVSDTENPCVEYEDVISEQRELNKDLYLKKKENKKIKNLKIPLTLEKLFSIIINALLRII